MNLITPHLAVGSRDDACDESELDNYDIDAILSLEPVSVPRNVLCQMQLSVRDRVPLPVEPLLRALDFIHQQISQGRRVLVHCQMGISRSPAIAAAYLHQHCEMSLEEAVGYLKHRRPEVDPHPALLDSLHTYFAAGRERAS